MHTTQKAILSPRVMNVIAQGVIMSFWAILWASGRSYWNCLNSLAIKIFKLFLAKLWFCAIIMPCVRLSMEKRCLKADVQEVVDDLNSILHVLSHWPKTTQLCVDVFKQQNIPKTTPYSKIPWSFHGKFSWSFRATITGEL